MNIEEELDKYNLRKIWWKNRRRMTWVCVCVLVFVILYPQVLFTFGFELEQYKFFFDTSVFALTGIIMSYFGLATIEDIKSKREKEK